MGTLSKENVSVLVADDESDMRTILASVLRSLEYTNLRYASDGLEALKLLEQKTTPVHVAFLDINMPGMTGIEVIKKVRMSYPECFCVIVSAHSDMNNVKSALGAGAKGFVVKPYTTKKIFDVLAKFEKEVLAK
jgi:two-component system, chemotaxis family, chemotaxis protein CheY